MVFGNQASVGKILGDKRTECIFAGPGTNDRNAYIQLFNEDKIKNKITDVLYFGEFDSSCEGLLNVIQAIVGAGLILRIWILTNSAQSVTGHEINFNPIQSQLLGFGKVIALEHPEFHCVRIDFDRSMTVAQLSEELDSNGKEDEVAIRENTRYVPRLISAQPGSEKTLTISPEGSYLITGGLGGLGLACTEWLLEKGARTIFLTARSAPKEALQARLNKYREKGATITIIQGDVSEQSDVSKLFESIHQNCPVLKGLIHAAGVADHDFITKQSWDRFSRVLAPKVKGTQNLAEALKAHKIELDFFVLFSSVSGVLGSAATSSYAAANYYLNEFAKYARKKGLPAISIAWGPWSDIGMAAGEEQRQLRLGYQLISAKEGVSAMEIALKSDEASAIIAPMNWAKYFENLQYVSSIYSSIQVGEEKPTILKTDELGLALEAAKPENRAKIVTDYLREITKELIGLGVNEKIDDKKGFFEMGMDSLMATELRNRLQKPSAIVVR